LRRRLAHHPTDKRLLLLDVLEADGGDHRDPRGQQILDVLAPAGPAAARRVGVRQPVDDAHPRRAPEDGVDVDRLAVAGAARGDPLDAGDGPGRPGRKVRLERADDHVLAARASPPRFVEQPERLAHAGRVAQEHLEPAAPSRALGRVEFPKPGVGIAPSA
jgi:hypothetical protein